MSATNIEPVELKKAYRATIDTLAPTDYYHISNGFEEATPDLQQILALIKIGLFDPINTYLFYPKIAELAKDTALKSQLIKVISHTIRAFFPINKEEAVFYNQMGALLFNLGATQEALICFQQFLKYDEPTEEILKNISACLGRL